jgi:glycosyltransferase involved in cell wall biosynthesis
VVSQGPFFVIPAHNEAINVGGVVARSIAEYPDARVVVVNDGSTDSTSQVARDAGATVVELPFNSGYGVALHTGLRWAAMHRAEVVVTLDADGQHDPLEVRKLLWPVGSGEADMVVGSRYLAKGALYNVPLIRRLAAGAFAILVSLLMRRRITDPTSGFQCLNAKALKLFVEMNDFPEKTPDADLLLYAHLQGTRIREVAVNMYADQGGDSMHGVIKSLFYTPKMLVAMAGVLLTRSRQ